MPSFLFLSDLLAKHEPAILADWLRDLVGGRHQRSDLQTEGERADHCARLLSGLREALAKNEPDLHGAAWREVRSTLEEIARTRARLGFPASETTHFILSLKKPLLRRLQERDGSRAELADEFWLLSEIIDGLGSIATDSYQATREEVIIRQQQDLLELSTPVVKLWDGILALPVIGTLDSARTQVVMESLLTRIVETGCEVAIIDITGVLTVDTLVAQHLIKTVTAARLMGADCIISGIRPQIAQTIIHLGVDLSDIMTKANLADAIRVALARTGYQLVRRATAGGGGRGDG